MFKLHVAWENSQHFLKKPLVSLQSTKIFYRDIPYCWCVTTQIWVVLLIGWSKILTTLKHYPDLGHDTSSASSFCSRFSDILGDQWWHCKNVSCFLRLNFRMQMFFRMFNLDIHVHVKLSNNFNIHFYRCYRSN